MSEMTTLESSEQSYCGAKKFLKHEGKLFSKILVAFSGGKDSLACVLQLLEMGIDKSFIELHHHDIDGREGGAMKMDWPITPDYCRRVALELGLPIYFSWREGGFEREMNRKDAPTAPVHFENPDQTVKVVGGKGPKNTRGVFPQVSANLSVRWCSSALKIDVMRRLISNSPRFDGVYTLVVTGERGEESPNRARYREFEEYKILSTKKRSVWSWRPVLKWSEQQVWDLIKKYGIRPHPAYELGWGRLSCMTCIFGSNNQWASIREHFPEQFNAVAQAEFESGKTIKRNMSVSDAADKGSCYQIRRDYATQRALVDLCRQEKWPGSVPIKWNPEYWEMPAGAFGEKVGPT